MNSNQTMEGQSQPSFLPKVSVVVPIYNGEGDLPDTIDCLLAQTYPPELVEYLLVDNNSRDRTAQIIQEAVVDAKTKGIKFCYLQQDQIQSSYAARNKGIKASTGEIIAFTDADCRPQPDWLTKLVQPFVKPEIGIVVGEVIALPGQTLLEKHAESQGLLSQKNTLDHPFCPYGQTANLAVRKKAFEEVGLFRPHLSTGGDADICWRIQKEATWQLDFVEDALIRHRHRNNFKALKSQWQRYGSSNRYLHQLHGVPLRPKVKGKYYLYLLTRWLLKELPVNTVKTIFQKATLIEMISTPINVFCTFTRDRGQAKASLPEEAKIIEKM